MTIWRSTDGNIVPIWLISNHRRSYCAIFARGFFLLILSEFLGYQNAWLSSHSATFAVDKMVFSYPICFPWWFILKSENAKFFHFDITSEGKMDSCVLWQMLRLRPSMDIKGLLNSAGDAFDSRMLLVFIFAQAFAFISAHFFSRFKAKWKNEAGTTFWFVVSARWPGGECRVAKPDSQTVFSTKL